MAPSGRFPPSRAGERPGTTVAALPAAAPGPLAARVLSVAGDPRAVMGALAAMEAGADAVVAELGALGSLAPLFRDLIAAGLYESLIALLTERNVGDSVGLRALAAARPGHDQEALNTAAVNLWRSGRAGGPYRFPLTIIPGYTPVRADKPVQLTDAGKARCDLARYDYETGRTGLLLVSGGAVHPSGTRWNEAIEMRRYLGQSGVPDERILVDPHARHTTTNLRNAGRIMLDLGIGSACIVTGGESAVFAQDFYLAHSTISTFDLRCRNELGYGVGRLEGVGDHRIAFSPSPDVRRPLWRDPLDH